MKKEEMSLKNTKAEILEALNKALERENKLNEIKSNPVLEENEKKKKEVIKETKENVSKNIFSLELVKKYNDLEEAILAMEEKLKDLYGVEGELNKLTLVVNAGKDVLSDLELKKKSETERLNNCIKELELEYKNKNEKLSKEYELKAKTLKLERDREVEEYNYKLKRDREIANNKWEDEKKTRETNLKTMELDAKKILDEALEKESYLKDLEKQVASIPSLLEKEYNRGVKDTTELLNKENVYQTELLKKDFQNTIDRQVDKIESLTKELDSLKDINSSLQDKMDKAYVEMKELATKTVEANGQVKIISNNQVDNK